MNSLPHIIAQNDPVWIGDFGRMRLYQGTYDRGTRTARIELGAETDDTLVIVSQVKPDAVSVNQTPVKFTAGAWGCDYSIPIPKGAAVVRIELRNCRNRLLSAERFSRPFRCLPHRLPPESPPFKHRDGSSKSAGVCRSI